MYMGKKIFKHPQKYFKKPLFWAKEKEKKVKSGGVGRFLGGGGGGGEENNTR